MPTYDDDPVVALVRAGLLIALGYGLYRVVKGVGELQPGEEVTGAEAAAVLAGEALADSRVKPEDDSSECHICGIGVCT